MKILLTNNHLARMGGTETWVLTMARHLSKEHEVGVFTHKKGFVSDLLEEFIDDTPVDYDLALINHNSCMDVGADRKIFTSHGIAHPLEEPRNGCDAYVAVNENTADFHGIKRVIKNPIDTERFSPTSIINKKPQSFLSIADCNLPFPAKKTSRYKDNMAELINDSDLVVSIGRGALEAMSCGRNVIVWDDRHYTDAKGDGYMDDPSRITGFTAGPRLLETIDFNEELSKYDQADGQRNREYIVENHEVSKIANQYLQL